MVHIASEVVVLLGLTFYFNQKNKKLMGHIEDLAQRLEEQEDLLQKHEQVIRRMLEFINQKTDSNVKPVEVVHSPENHNQATVQAKNNKKSKTSEKKEIPKIIQKKEIYIPQKKEKIHVSSDDVKPKIIKNTPKVEEIESEDEDEDESDLDAELAEELKELEDSDSSEIEEIGLKKRSQ